jgi:hypothetical protein
VGTTDIDFGVTLWTLNVINFDILMNFKV